MTVLFMILGFLMVATGFTCFFTPLATFLSYGYFLAIIALVYGILGIVQGIRYRRFGVGFVFSIISVIFGICLLVSPYFLAITDAVMLYLTAAWFVLMGIVNIIMSVTVTKATGSKIWILHLIIGILAILLGCYAFFHPAVMAVSIGILIGFFFIETGFTLIFSSVSR